MINILKAIQALYPNVARAIDNGFPNVKAFDANGNEISLDLEAINSWVDPDEYKAKRQAEYPSYADQFDTIFHNGLDAWKAQIQAVKDKYPKGNS